MNRSQLWGFLLAGAAAGAVNGLFGAGGGMVLIPLLTLLTPLKEGEIFPSGVAVIAPMCLVSLGITAISAPLPLSQALPYLAGSALGGLPAAMLGQKIPVHWLHRGLGVLILWGGVRNLW